MNHKYSDSLFPWGIGASFVIVMLALMFGGTLVGVLLGPYLEKNDFKQGGGIILLVIILMIVVGPMIYNRRVSRFEKENNPLEKIDHFGIIQGLRGVFIRLLLYEDGFEIRAFYHRYYIPFDKIEGISIERILFCNRINTTAKLRPLVFERVGPFSYDAICKLLDCAVNGTQRFASSRLS